jgi:hypothetical protein
MSPKHIFVALIAATFVLAGCDSTDPQPPVAPQSLALTLDGVAPLKNGFHYEGWAIIGGNPVSTGKFNVNDAGQIVNLQGQPIANGQFATGRDLSATTMVVITIEPPVSGPEPSNTKFLAGGISANNASLTMRHAEAVGRDFAASSGRYILATPTAPNASDLSGIWFIDPTGIQMAPGLDLPTLPSGWIYEGWAVIDGMPVTTGKFRDVAMADMAAPFSGPEPGPAFPGEDFIMNAPPGLSFPTNLQGAMAVITIEPFPDDSADPFPARPLAAMIPGNAQPMTLYMMQNEAGMLPSATARIQ